MERLVPRCYDSAVSRLHSVQRMTPARIRCNYAGSNRLALAVFDCKILPVSAVLPTKKAFSSWAESQVPF